MAIVGLAAEDDDAEAAHGRNGNGVAARAVATIRKPATGIMSTTLDGEFSPPNDGEEYDDAAARNEYIGKCTKHILAAKETGTSREAIVKWFAAQAPARRDFGLSQAEVDFQRSLIKESFPEEAKVPA
jgi:hypothetical protein